MRFPWSKDKEESDLARDDDPGYEEEGEPAEVEETLDDVEPDLKARFDRHLAAQRDQWQAEQRTREDKIRELGFDFTGDGTPAIRDVNRVKSWAKDLIPQAEAAPARAQAVEEPEEEINFFDMDAAKFNQLVEKRAGKLVDAKLAEFSQRNQWQEQEVKQVAARDALRRAESAVSRLAPHYAPLLSHPDFESTMLETLSNTPPEQYRDDRNLAALVGGVGAFLDMAQLPKTKGRDREGRFASTQASRATLAQVGPSRDSSRSGVPRDPEEEAARRFLSEFTGRDVSAKEVEAAAAESISDWRRAKAAKR